MATLSKVMKLVANAHRWPLLRRRAAVAREGFVAWSLLAMVAAGTLAAWWWWRHADAQPADAAIVLHKVAREDFSLDVTERGEIESAGVTEVVSEVKSKNTPGVSILKIVPEGSVVKKGDFLVELDSSAFTEERNTQQIAVNTAAALVVESRNIYETALIAKQEYLDGTYVQERQTIESEVFVAEENLNRAKEYYEYSKRLAAKGYVNQLQLEADKFAVEKSRKEQDAAKTKLKVLDDYTKAKMLKQLESDIVISKAKWESDKKSYDLAAEKLAEIDLQISRCTIAAPKDGTVTYAHNRQNWVGDDFIVKEGAVIRERQAIIHLPDPKSMRVSLNVNESLIQHVHSGMPATVSPVGIGDRVFQGTVISINQYAEPSGWRKANVKEYKAMVSIDEPAPELRSGMTASVTIHCDEVSGAIVAPVQSVYAHGGKFYAFVYDNGKWQARPIKTGPTNDKFFVIEEGLAEGEKIAMYPRGYLDQVSLPELPPQRRQQATARAAQPSGEKADTVAKDDSVSKENAGAKGEAVAKEDAGAKDEAVAKEDAVAAKGADKPVAEKPTAESSAAG
jgi:RND family efflux transporter MFP subunit